MSYSRTTQFNSRRQGNYGRNRNTVAFASAIKLGPISNAIIIALLLTLLGLLYLTQAGSVSGYDYESNDVSNKISTLTEQKSDLAVENARLTNRSFRIMSVSPTRFVRRSRVGFLFSIVLVVSVIFVVQLFVVQVVRHDYYVTQADNEQIKKFTLKAQRGEIYAMDGSDPKPLVMNETVYKVWADPTQVSDKQAVVDTLNSVAGGNVVDNFSALIDKRPSRYQILTKYITRTQAELIKKKKLAGIGFEVGTRRVYPEGRLASQVLGFVNHEGKGVYGFEQANNQTLSGRDGMLKTVTDARDVPGEIRRFRAHGGRGRAFRHGHGHRGRRKRQDARRRASRRRRRRTPRGPRHGRREPLRPFSAWPSFLGGGSSG